MQKTRPAVLIGVLALGGCAQIGEVSYETSCAKPEEARSTLVRDLCQQFGVRGSVQLERSGQTVACGPSGAPT